MDVPTIDVEKNTSNFQIIIPQKCPLTMQPFEIDDLLCYNRKCGPTHAISFKNFIACKLNACPYATCINGKQKITQETGIEYISFGELLEKYNNIVDVTKKRARLKKDTTQQKQSNKKNKKSIIVISSDDETEDSEKTESEELDFDVSDDETYADLYFKEQNSWK